MIAVLDEAKTVTASMFELPKDLRFVLDGESPYLMANPSNAMDRGQGGRMVGTRKEIPTPEEEAESLVYRLPDGRLYVPATQVRSAIINAAKRLKEKGRQSSMANAVSAALSFEEAEFPIAQGGRPITAYTIDKRYARIGKAGVMRCRPSVLVPWTLDCHFGFDEALVTRHELAQMIDLAGKRCGIGDYRPGSAKPGSSGWFGKFRLKSIAVEG